MKYLSVMLLLVFVVACDQSAQEVTILDNDQQRISYSIGADIGNKLKRGAYPIDVASLAQGIKDRLEEKELLLTDAEMREIFETFN